MERMGNYLRGKAAEDHACRWLAAAGYTIAAQRYRCSVGEIDIVATCGKRLSFVEVKHRRSLAQAAYAITPRQQRRIINAAECWLQSHSIQPDDEIAFDAILIAPAAQPLYIPDAFRPH